MQMRKRKGDVVLSSKEKIGKKKKKEKGKTRPICLNTQPEMWRTSLISGEERGGTGGEKKVMLGKKREQFPYHPFFSWDSRKGNKFRKKKKRRPC